MKKSLELGGQLFTPTDLGRRMRSVGETLIPSHLRPIGVGMWEVWAEVRPAHGDSNLFLLKIHEEDPAEPLGALYDAFHRHG